MDSELKARGVHRRVQRLKARYSPTASYDDIIPTDLTGNPASASGDAVSSAAPSSTAAAPTSAPTSATSTTPPAASSTPSAAQPATSSTTDPAPATSTTTSSTDPATSATSTSTSSTDSATPTSTSQTSTSAPSPSTTPTSADTPTQTKATQATQSQQHTVASAGSITGHVSGSGSATLTNSAAELPASASAAASASSTPTSSSTQTGTIVGIVVAVLVGVVGIVFAVTYFMRRARRDKDDDFSADAFRRQSVMLPDPDDPTVPDRGFAARPPSMIQQRLGQGAPVSFDQHPYAGNNGYYGYSEQPSFNPGQVVAMPGQPMPPQAWTPDSSRPFFAPMGESPMGSPVSVAPYDSQYDANGQFIRHPSPGPNEFLNRQPSMDAASQLNRQPSNGPNQFLERQPSYGAAVALARQPSYGPGAVMPPPPPVNMAMDAPDHSRYVDLNRSSVSPFQAEQYAEISHQLNTAPPMPLPTPMVAAAAEEAFIKEDEYVPEVTTPRPLNLPAQPPQSPTGSPPFDEAEADDLPRAPSPTFSRKTHVDSMPPMLPQRSFSPVTLDFPMNASPAHAAPSPLATSVAMPSPPAEAHLGDGPASPQDAPLTGIPAENHQAVPRPGNNNASGARPDTVYTMYDDDDVYGGI